MDDVAKEEPRAPLVQLKVSFVKHLFLCGTLLEEIPHGMGYQKCFAGLPLLSLQGGPLLFECSLIEAGAHERAHSCVVILEHFHSCIIWKSGGCLLECFYHKTALSKIVCRPLILLMGRAVCAQKFSVKQCESTIYGQKEDDSE